MEHLSYVDDFVQTVEGACVVIFFICTFETKPFWTGICNLVVMCFGCFLTTTSTISQIFFLFAKKTKITKATISTCVLSVWGQCVQHLHIDEPRWLWKTQDQGVLLVEVRSVGDSLWPGRLKFVPRSFQFFRGKHPKPIPSMYGIFTVPTFGCF